MVVEGDAMYAEMCETARKKQMGKPRRRRKV